jgi:hypothetical protein
MSFANLSNVREKRIIRLRTSQAAKTLGIDNVETFATEERDGPIRLGHDPA